MTGPAKSAKPSSSWSDILFSFPGNEALLKITTPTQTHHLTNIGDRRDDNDTLFVLAPLLLMPAMSVHVR